MRKGLPADRALQVARQILEGPHLSVLATTNADRSAQMSVIFVKPDGADIFFSTIEGRRKTTNMLRDPRVTLLLHSLIASATDSAYATIHGTVELTDDPGGAFHQVCTTFTWAVRRHLQSPGRTGSSSASVLNAPTRRSRTPPNRGVWTVGLHQHRYSQASAQRRDGLPDRARISRSASPKQ